MQTRDVAQHLMLARLIERRQRFVHQQQPRAHQQGAADRHPLLLATGQIRRPPFKQGFEAQQADHLVELDITPAGRGEIVAVTQIGMDRQMRKQAAILENVTDATARHRHINAARAVKQAFAVDADRSIVRRHQPGNGIDHG